MQEAIDKAEQHIQFTKNSSMHDYTNIILRELLDIIEAQDKKLTRIKTWIAAYPIETFPEPDFEEIFKILKENGHSLGSVSASNMRNVLDGIKKIIEGE